MKHCILLKTETRNRLKNLGSKSETYDQIISRLIFSSENIGSEVPDTKNKK